MKKIFKAGLILLAVVFTSFFISLPLCSAAIDTAEVDDIFKQYETINYAKPCIYNGTYCSSNAGCNYTMYFPNKTIFIDNQPATNQVAYHNYSIAFYTLGIHQVDMVCCDTIGCGAETFYAQITPTGDNTLLGLYILLIVLSYGLIIFGISKQDITLTLLGSFGLYFFGIWMIVNGLDIYKNWMTGGFGILTLATAFYVSARTVLELLQGNY